MTSHSLWNRRRFLGATAGTLTGLQDQVTGCIVWTPKYLCNGPAQMSLKLPIRPAVTHRRRRIVTIARRSTASDCVNGTFLITQ